MKLSSVRRKGETNVLGWIVDIGAVLVVLYFMSGGGDSGKQEFPNWICVT